MLTKKNSVDVRIQFLLLFLLGSYSFLGTFNDVYLVSSILLVGLVLQGYYSLFLTYLITLISLFLLNKGFVFIQSVPALNYLGILLGIGTKFLPTLIIASSINQVPLGKTIASLERLKLPKSILLTLAVSLRFFPILLVDIKMIQDNAYVRKLSYRNIKNWLNPFTLFEFTIVPLLMRTIQLADDLSANGTTRGITYPGKKTSLYTIQFAWFDLTYLLTLATLFLIIKLQF